LADTIVYLLTDAGENTLKGKVTNLTDIADINTFDSNLLYEKIPPCGLRPQA